MDINKFTVTWYQWVLLAATRQNVRKVVIHPCLNYDFFSHIKSVVSYLFQGLNMRHSWHKNLIFLFGQIKKLPFRQILMLNFQQCYKE